MDKKDSNENSKEPRPLTEDEARERFLTNVWEMISFWKQGCSKDVSVEDRIEGVAFSILSALDGCAVGLPGFIVAPDPAEDDREFCAKEGLEWWKTSGDKRKDIYWPRNDPANCDISGGLHELFYDVGRKKGFKKKNG